jgi:phage replication-related protein YjqB (UPF0714/DUF867 family)
MTEKKEKHKFSDFFHDGEIHPDYQGKIKEHSEKKGKIGVFAIHGGKIDKHTDEIVHHVAENTDASKYVFESF